MAKIKFGISNCYFAKATDDGTGVLTYATPKALIGARSLSLEQNGDTNIFYADNIAFFTSSANNGYQGDLELAMLSDDFRKDILGETEDTNGLLVELADAPTVEFALLFQFETDENAIRHCMYRCTASRPAVASNTKEESIEPQTETITITAMPRINDHVVKAKCLSTSVKYATWFTEVAEPDL